MIPQKFNIPHQSPLYLWNPNPDLESQSNMFTLLEEILTSLVQTGFKHIGMDKLYLSISWLW